MTQPYQPADRLENDQKAALLCECGLERTGGLGLSSTGFHSISSASRHHLDGCSSRYRRHFMDLFINCNNQMPIRDGYSATHAIRTEAPWRDKPEIRGVPIVAMTASAIQGDKEKCTLAGMDVSLDGVPYIEELVTDALQDYLAKPVKGKLLEKVRAIDPTWIVN